MPAPLFADILPGHYFSHDGGIYRKIDSINARNILHPTDRAHFAADAAVIPMRHLITVHVLPFAQLSVTDLFMVEGHHYIKTSPTQAMNLLTGVSTATYTHATDRMFKVRQLLIERDNYWRPVDSAERREEAAERISDALDTVLPKPDSEISEDQHEISLASGRLIARTQVPYNELADGETFMWAGTEYCKNHAYAIVVQTGASVAMRDNRMVNRTFEPRKREQFEPDTEVKLSFLDEASLPHVGVVDGKIDDDMWKVRVLFVDTGKEFEFGAYRNQIEPLPALKVGERVRIRTNEGMHYGTYQGRSTTLDHEVATDNAGTLLMSRYHIEPVRAYVALGYNRDGYVKDSTRAFVVEATSLDDAMSRADDQMPPQEFICVAVFLHNSGTEIKLYSGATVTL